MFGQDNTCPALLVESPANADFAYGAVTRCGAPFQALPLSVSAWCDSGCSRFARRYSGNLG